jgi:Protein of unknown function (DUF2393)
MIDTANAREARKQFPLALLAGLGIVVLIAAIFVLTSKTVHVAPAPAPVPLNFGAKEKAYAPQIGYSNIQLAKSSNLLNQQFTYINGTVTNGGDQTIQRLAMSVDFYDDVDNKDVALHDTETIIGPNDQPLPPHSQRDFSVTLDRYPESWNQQMPHFHTAGLVLQP